MYTPHRMHEFSVKGPLTNALSARLPDSRAPWSPPSADWPESCVAGVRRWDALRDLGLVPDQNSTAQLGAFTHEC